LDRRPPPCSFPWNRLTASVSRSSTGRCGRLVRLSERGTDTDVRYTIDLQPLLKVRTPIDDAAEKFLTRAVERSLARVKAILEA